jgi:hypothetical protein
VQTALESAEPVAFAARLARDPLPGHPARSVFQPVGFDDPGFPPSIYDAMALASGTQQAGEIVWSSLQTSLAVGERQGIATYPVRDNARSIDGRPYTGAVVQYRPDGILDGHHVFAQLDEVKFQYRCFLASAEAGHPTVFAPGGAGDACP